MISFFRVFTNGFVDFWRNIWLSAAATLVMTITLVILSTLLFVFVIAGFALTSARERVDMSVYFKIGLSEKQIFAVRDDLVKNSKVKQVAYVSPEEGLIRFKQLNQGKQEILDALSQFDENPIPATLQVKATNLEDLPEIAQSLQADQYKPLIDKVNYEDNRELIERLSQILQFIKSFGIALIVVFSLIAVLVIFNTITLTIYNRREEIEIMRLVGATNWYIRGPFLVEALMYSVVATIITSSFLIPLYTNARPEIANYFGTADVLNSPYLAVAYLILMQLVVAVILSIISTTWAMRKYLRI